MLIKKRNEPEKYRVGDQVLLSTKNLKFQIQGKCLKKLTK